MNFLFSMLPGLFKLGGKLIQDADKRADYAFRVQEMMNEFMIAMLSTKTYPWIDGLVKLSYAAESIVKGLFRPVVATCMFGFGIYAELHEIVLSETIQVMLYGAFPAWGISRHNLKAKKQKEIDEDW